MDSCVGYMADHRSGGEGPMVEWGRMSLIRMRGAVNGYGNLIACEAPLTLTPEYIEIMPGVGLMVRVVGLRSQEPELKSCSAVELIQGGFDSARHPSEIGKMSTSLLVSCGDPSRIVPNSPGDCFNSNNTLHSEWSQWMYGWMDIEIALCEQMSLVKLVTPEGKV